MSCLSEQRSGINWPTIRDPRAAHGLPFSQLFGKNFPKFTMIFRNLIVKYRRKQKRWFHLSQTWIYIVKPKMGALILHQAAEVCRCVFLDYNSPNGLGNSGSPPPLFWIPFVPHSDLLTQKQFQGPLHYCLSTLYPKDAPPTPLHL